MHTVTHILSPPPHRSRSALEPQALGNDKLQRAMMETVHSEAAGPLFDQAEAHYRDAVITSYVQWSSVHLMRGERKLQVRWRGGGVCLLMRVGMGARLHVCMGTRTVARRALSKAGEWVQEGGGPSRHARNTA